MAVGNVYCCMNNSKEHFRYRKSADRNMRKIHRIRYRISRENVQISSYDEDHGLVC